MKLFAASFETILLRYYLLMFVIIGSFFTGLPLLALLAVPILLSTLTGISYTSSKEPREAKVITARKSHSQAA